MFWNFNQKYIFFSSSKALGMFGPFCFISRGKMFNKFWHNINARFNSLEVKKSLSQNYTVLSLHSKYFVTFLFGQKVSEKAILKTFKKIFLCNLHVTSWEHLVYLDTFFSWEQFDTFRYIFIISLHTNYLSIRSWSPYVIIYKFKGAVAFLGWIWLSKVTVEF